MIFRKKQLNKRWEKRPQLYKGRFYYFRKLAQALILLSIVVGFVGVVLYFKNSEALLIQKIEITSVTQHIAPKDIVTLSGITQRDKLFSIRLADVAENLYRHPWIESVQVRREFPDKIQIHVTERQAYAYVDIGGLYIADENGILFKKKEASENYKIPVITGLDKSMATQSPELTKLYLQRIFAFYKSVANEAFFEHYPLSQVHFDPVMGLTVFADNHNLEIFYGHDDFQDKQARLNQIAALNPNVSALFSRLDLNLKNRVIARKKL